MAEKTNTLLWMAVVVLALLMVFPVSADIYRWTDADGKVHFSDTPPEDGQREPAQVEVVNPEPLNAVAMPEPRPEKPASTRASVASGGEKVVMYATEWCPYCRKARRYFRKNRIPFVEYDVEKSERRMREFKRLGGTGYPLILIGKRKMQGFSAEGFERRYNR